MPYVMLNTDPEALPLDPLPIGFDVILSERDLDEEGTGEAIWVVTHIDDATLLAEVQTERGLTPLEHGAGTWDGSALTRRVQGTDIVAARGLFATLRGTLSAGQKVTLDGALAKLPADPRA